MISDAEACLLVGIAVLYSALPLLAQEQHVLVRRGQQLFVDHGCYGCYTVGKMGTPMGPDLSNMGAKYSSSYLIGWVRDPSTQKPTAYMRRLS